MWNFWGVQNVDDEWRVLGAVRGNDDGWRVGAGKMLGGEVVALKRWMWGGNGREGGSDGASGRGK